MNITIVNGIEKTEFPKEYEGLIRSISELKNKHSISQFDINNLTIHGCTGCWTCWVHDPGKCIFEDDMVAIYKSIVKADFLLFISSVKAGFIQSDIKKVIERMFALLLPHMTILNDELHHIPRYDNQPKIGLVIVGEEKHDNEQEEIFREYLYRLSLNFNKDKHYFLHYYNCAKEKEFVNEFNNI